MELGPLYRQHHTFVWQALRCLGVHDHEVDDAVQDVFVVVYRRLDAFEGRSSIRTWLYGIARRVAWKYRTRAQREVARVSSFRESLDDADLEAATDRQRAFEVLQTFLEELDDDRREAFVLAEFASLRAPEIARALDVNLNTVYSRLRSARIELDRTVTRLRARDAASVVSAAKRQRPEPRRAAQAWAAVVATVGLPQVGTAVGIWGVSAASAGWAAAVVLGAGLLGATVSTVTTEGVDAEEVADLARPDARARKEPAPSLSLTGGTDSASFAAAPRPMPVGADGTGARLQGSPRGTLPERRSEPANRRDDRDAPENAASPVADATAQDSPMLADEVAQVRAIRAAVESGRRVVEAIERYRTKYPDGSLRIEVEALAVEMECRTRSQEASRFRDAFLERWPDHALASRLASICADDGYDAAHEGGTGAP